MAESLVKVPSDSLDCPICCESFDTEEHRARILPCGHSLCDACLREIITRSGRRCPTCRTAVLVSDKGAEAFPINFQISEIVERRNQIHEEQRSSKCSNCGLQAGNQHLMFCSTCFSELCAKCSHSKQHKQHEVESLADYSNSIDAKIDNLLIEKAVDANGCKLKIERLRECSWILTGSCTETIELIDGAISSLNGLLLKAKESRKQVENHQQSTERKLGSLISTVQQRQKNAFSEIKDLKAASLSTIQQKARLIAKFKTAEDSCKDEDVSPDEVSVKFQLDEQIRNIVRSENMQLGELSLGKEKEMQMPIVIQRPIVQIRKVNKRADDEDGRKIQENADHQSRKGKRNNDVGLSKNLSFLLRHGATKQGLKFVEGGFLYVDNILELRNFQRITEEDIKRVVENDNKQRFTMKQDRSGLLLIRANEGHTLNVGVDLKPITHHRQAPVVIHGTYFRFWASIKETGLSRMTRQYIHFAPGLPGETNVISGVKESCEILIYIDIFKALRDGISFFTSANNVIVSPGNEDGNIPHKYFKKVVEYRTGKRMR